MKSQHAPIVIVFFEGHKNVIYYKDSVLLTKLRYYPYFQLAVIALFLLVSYLAFSSSRKAEQNRVWVGMAKETAHQLGTPLSSLMAWLEYMKMKGTEVEYTGEIEKGPAQAADYYRAIFKNRFGAGAEEGEYRRGAPACYGLYPFTRLGESKIHPDESFRRHRHGTC
jgi:hypothetical protein